MRRRSLRPPRRGVTHSRYSPAWTATVSPGCATAAARLIVRNGLSSEPSAVSDPVVETWSVNVMALILHPSRAWGTLPEGYTLIARPARLASIRPLGTFSGG